MVAWTTFLWYTWKHDRGTSFRTASRGLARLFESACHHHWPDWSWPGGSRTSAAFILRRAHWTVWSSWASVTHAWIGATSSLESQRTYPPGWSSRSRRALDTRPLWHGSSRGLCSHHRARSRCTTASLASL